jgi:hypothetical protein
VKLEYLSPTGSYKDRMAKAMIDGAEAKGLLRPKGTVVEYTGGPSSASTQRRVSRSAEVVDASAELIEIHREPGIGVTLRRDACPETRALGRSRT